MNSPRLVIDIEKRFTAFTLDVRLEIGTEVLVLFGPSGAGKTTTLDLVAGLVTPDAGEIALDGTTFFRRRPAGEWSGQGRSGHRRSGQRQPSDGAMSSRGREAGGATSWRRRPAGTGFFRRRWPRAAVNLPARKRHIGYVFQHYALFPHLTALDNVAYPLRGRPDREPRALALLERMHLSAHARRYPHELSGGQQQRVAVARALAAEPRLLLLDEPFSALDAAVREGLQRDLRALQRELGLVVLYVTHRLEDAFAMGDRVAVIRSGEVAQVGPIEDVFRRPASAGVAEVMGIRNLFHARVAESTPDGVLLDWDGLRLRAPAQALEPGTCVTAYARPEDIKILYPDRPITSAVHHNQVDGRVIASQTSASLRTLRVELPHGHAIDVRFPPLSYASLDLAAGAEVKLSLRKEGVVILQEVL